MGGCGNNLPGFWNLMASNFFRQKQLVWFGGGGGQGWKNPFHVEFKTKTPISFCLKRGNLFKISKYSLYYIVYLGQRNITFW